MRGGTWNDEARNARSAYRNANFSGNRNHNLGFRFALSSIGSAPPWIWRSGCRWTRCRILPQAGDSQPGRTARPPGCW